MAKSISSTIKKLKVTYHIVAFTFKFCEQRSHLHVEHIICEMKSVYIMKFKTPTYITVHGRSHTCGNGIIIFNEVLALISVENILHGLWTHINEKLHVNYRFEKG